MPEKFSIWNCLNTTTVQLHYVQVGSWRTRVLDTGGNGTPIIAMSGTGGHLEAYSRNIAALSREHRLIAYDFPGHGYTTLAEADLEIADYVEHLRLLMDALELSHAHVSGESLGGWVAVKFAAAHPDRVDTLVLNTPGGAMASPQVMNRLRELSQAAADDPTTELIRARLEWLMAAPSSVTAELVDVRRAIYSQPGFSRSMRHILCLQDEATRRRNMITDQELSGIRQPALVLWTSDDPSGPASVGLWMAQNLAHGRFELINEAGHWPQWEQSEQFNEMVSAFLREHDHQVDP